jgi:D-amino-acid oxidase
VKRALQFRTLRPDELPPGFDTGSTFDSVCINTAIYLPWLAGQCLASGATVRRGIAEHMCDAANMHASGRRADVVINCTGLGALKLGGVEDSKMYPARGQIVVVRNEVDGMFFSSGTDHGADEAMYIMQRAAGSCKRHPVSVLMGLHIANM